MQVSGALWFVLTLQKLLVKTNSVLLSYNKKHASKEILNSGNFIYNEKRGTFTKWKSEMFYQKKLKKWIVRKKC